MSSRVPAICVTTSDKKMLPRARQLADSLLLPLIYPAAEQTIKKKSFCLKVTPIRLELYKINDPQLSGAVYTDFSQDPGSQIKTGGGHDLLIKAAVIKGKRSPTILDATGGLGRDAFLLASRGCKVHLVERSPIIAALTRDGLQRAAEVSATSGIVGRMTLVAGESIQHLQQIQTEGMSVDVIYLDPMFSMKKKKSKSKKDLQMLQYLVGPDQDSDELLNKALQTPCKRVVVKRPAKARFLADLQPSFQYKGRSTRYDVYLI